MSQGHGSTKDIDRAVWDRDSATACILVSATIYSCRKGFIADFMIIDIGSCNTGILHCHPWPWGIRLVWVVLEEWRSFGTLYDVRGKIGGSLGSIAKPTNSGQGSTCNAPVHTRVASCSVVNTMTHNTGTIIQETNTSISSCHASRLPIMSKAGLREESLSR